MVRGETDFECAVCNERKDDATNPRSALLVAPGVRDGDYFDGRDDIVVRCSSNGKVLVAPKANVCKACTKKYVVPRVGRVIWNIEIARDARTDEVLPRDIARERTGKLMVAMHRHEDDGHEDDHHEDNHLNEDNNDGVAEIEFVLIGIEILAAEDIAPLAEARIETPYQSGLRGETAAMHMIDRATALGIDHLVNVVGIYDSDNDDFQYDGSDEEFGEDFGEDDFADDDFEYEDDLFFFGPPPDAAPAVNARPGDWGAPRGGRRNV